jgi:hypothetical protein
LDQWDRNQDHTQGISTRPGRAGRIHNQDIEIQLHLPAFK